MSGIEVKTMRIMSIAALIVGSVLTLGVTRAQQAGVKRTDLQRHDLGVPGREAIQVRVDLDPGVAFPNHTHPGEEIIYVLAGTLEYQIEGKPPVTLLPKMTEHPEPGGVNWMTRNSSLAAKSASSLQPKPP